MSQYVQETNGNSPYAKDSMSHPSNGSSDVPTLHPHSFIMRDDTPPLRALHSETVYRENAGADFTVTKVTLKNVQTGEQFSVHYVSVKDGHAGAVCVAELADSGCLLFARHWRPTVQSWAWEFPRGMGETGESGATTAIREFREETGMNAVADSSRILQYIHADTGVLKDSIAVVSLVVETSENTIGENAAVQREHDWELAHMHWIKIADIETMIAQGMFNDAITLAAYAIWKTNKNLR